MKCEPYNSERSTYKMPNNEANYFCIEDNLTDLSLSKIDN